jgi:hypothetical protein
LADALRAKLKSPSEGRHSRMNIRKSNLQKPLARQGFPQPEN